MRKPLERAERMRGQRGRFSWYDEMYVEFVGPRSRGDGRAVSSGVVIRDVNHPRRTSREQRKTQVGASLADKPEQTERHQPAPPEQSVGRERDGVRDMNT